MSLLALIPQLAKLLTGKLLANGLGAMSVLLAQTAPPKPAPILKNYMIDGAIVVVLSALALFVVCRTSDRRPNS